jgi:hypothetical protein
VTVIVTRATCGDAKYCAQAPASSPSCAALMLAITSNRSRSGPRSTSV